MASWGQKRVGVTAELADAWLPVFWLAGKSEERWGEALRKGRLRRDAQRAPLDIHVGGLVAIGEGLESLRDMGRPQMALYVGGMGAREKNFYNDVFASYGYEREAKEIQDLFLAGKKDEAAAAIPDDFIEKTTLVGPEGFVRDRLVALRESGVTSLNVSFAGRTSEERVAMLGRLQEVIATL